MLKESAIGGRFSYAVLSQQPTIFITEVIFFTLEKKYSHQKKNIKQVNDNSGYPINKKNKSTKQLCAPNISCDTNSI